MKMNKIAGIVTAAWILAASTQADVITHYYDDFSGLQANELNGTAPDIRPGSETWTANSIYKADGSFVSGNTSAFLAFTPEAGKVYTLSVDVSNVAGTVNSHWAGIGFGTSSLTTVQNVTGVNGLAAVQLRVDGAARSAHSGNNQVASVSGFGSAATLSMVLTTYADSTPWTVDYFANITSLGSYTWAIAGDPGIANVAISAGSNTTISGTFDNFTLTVIPEPATMGMLGLGALIMLAIRRKLRV